MSVLASESETTTRLSAAEVLARLREQKARRAATSRRRTAGVWITRIAILAAFVFAWEWASSTGAINAAFFSQPSAILKYMGGALMDGSAVSNGIVTLREMALAFIIGSVSGIAFALLRVSFPYFSDVSSPYITVLNALPRVALAPMFVIWFGLGEESKVALAVSLVVFIVMITTEAGTRSIEQEYITAMRAMGANRSQIFTRVLLPGSVPSIFAGLRLAVVYSLLGVVFGEMLAANAGLGQQIQYFGSTFRTDGVLGTVLFLAIIALALNWLVALAEARLSRWR